MSRSDSRAGPRTTSPRKGVIRVNGVDCPVTATANDGQTKLRRYEVRAVIYARNQREAKRRLGEADMILDEAELRRGR
jgi:hypothetical protein